MAHIFKHKETGKLYTIEHLIVDIKYANCGYNTGIHAFPYKWKGEIIKHIKGESILYFNPVKFLEDNFSIISEIY